jgi:hypothetical protein
MSMSECQRTNFTAKESFVDFFVSFQLVGAIETFQACQALMFLRVLMRVEDVRSQALSNQLLATNFAIHISSFEFFGLSQVLFLNVILDLTFSIEKQTANIAIE